MRIVYREAPSQFRVLRSVDHTSPAFSQLNAEYEQWQAKYLEDYKKGARIKVEKSTSPEKTAGMLARNKDARLKFYGRQGRIK